MQQIAAALGLHIHSHTLLLTLSAANMTMALIKKAQFSKLAIFVP